MNRLANVWETGNNYSLGISARYIKVVVSMHGYASQKSSRTRQVHWAQMTYWVLFFQHPWSLFDHTVHIHTLRLNAILTFPKIRRQVEFYARGIYLYIQVNIPRYMYNQRCPVKIQTPAHRKLIICSMTVQLCVFPRHYSSATFLLRFHSRNKTTSRVSEMSLFHLYTFLKFLRLK
jgi:hypothetical protein